MDAWQAVSLALVFVLYLFTAVLRSAYASLSPLALKRVLARRAAADPGNTLGIRVAFDAGHHLLLIAGAILLLRALSDAGVSNPYMAGGGILALSVLAAHGMGRVIALANPERAFAVTWTLASLVYTPLDALARPLFSALERLHLASRKERQEEDSEAAAEEIEALIDVGRREGILELEEGRLIRHVVEFHDAVVREVMSPRTEIVAVPSSATMADLRDLMAEKRHSRLPVFKDQIDDIVGVVHLKDLLDALRSSDPGEPIAPLIRDAFFVPESKQVADLLREFQSRKTQIAVVIDEYGGTAGVVTVEDLLEEIVGEIQEEQDQEEPGLSREGDGRYLVRGAATVDDLNEAMGTDFPSEGFETVAGLIYNELGRIPRAGEIVEVGSLRLEILKADSRRILLVRASRPAGAESSPGPARPAGA